MERCIKTLPRKHQNLSKNQVFVFEAAVKHVNWSTNESVVILVMEVQVLEEDEKVVVIASSGSCVSVESTEMLSTLNIPWVILNLSERSALLNESNEVISFFCTEA
ncbi:uncharacterized protein LOC113283806 isoform X1 [Papaver somniferum]|uniref:uncharacterized protein LOC113283806 isoform X1 n=1 Tax=Papaver somniferum TaxID=3469 RepID=UPI000E705EB7|nr:uncharacterized protein LOC113283806 isoform X1 [Papaver somniferum]